MARIIPLILLATALTACEKAPPLALISYEESQQPEARGAEPSLADGPEIIIVAPHLQGEIKSPFPIEINFKPGPSGSAPDMDSLKLTYKKLWGIDITDRVIDYLTQSGINVPETEMPLGKHRLEIYIEDDDDNVSKTLISLKITK